LSYMHIQKLLHLKARTYVLYNRPKVSLSTLLWWFKHRWIGNAQVHIKIPAKEYIKINHLNSDCILSHDVSRFKCN